MTDTNTRPMMKCGHTANALKAPDDTPVCVICMGRPEAETVDEDYKVDESRMMRCSYDKPGRGGGGKQRKHEDGDSVRVSNPQSAFFSQQPDSEWDSYYCGCWGWD